MKTSEQNSMGTGSSTVAPFDSCDNITTSYKKKSLYCCGCYCFRRKNSIETVDDSTKLEARAWAGNFDNMMQSKIGRKCFQDFLKSQYSDENMNFWMATDDYRLKSHEVRRELAKAIYDDYISSISPCEVSLDARIRTEIEDNLHLAELDLFKEAQKCVYNTMYRDCFPRFMKSKNYKKLIA